MRGRRSSPSPTPSCICTASARRAPAARWATSTGWARPRRSAGAELAHAALDLLDAHHVLDAPVEERPGGGEILRAVVEPEQQGRGVDARQQRALGVEVEVRRAVAGGVPD